MAEKIQIISDSCCDATPTMRKTLKLESAPLKIILDGKNEYIDDQNLDVKKMLLDMKASKNPVSTAAPAPGEFVELMEEAEESVVITLSQNLSGSYNSAISARDMVKEDFPEKKILVLDSKSASAGETLLALYVNKRIGEGATFEDLEEELPTYRDNIRTYFVLEDLSTLIKNGRIPRMAGMLGTILMLRPIMGENGNGEIIPLEKVRGTKKALEKLFEIIDKKTVSSPAGSLNMVISYCECLETATELKKKFQDNCPAFETVSIVPTSGLSSTYANIGGIIIAIG